MRNASIISAAVAVIFSQSASANDLFFQRTIQNTDWTQAGLGGMRGVGSGNISLAGITGQVTQAYLYWHGPTNSTSPGANANVSFAGAGVVGTNIGFSDDNFWNFTNSQAYRADVTSLVPGNGAYALSGFLKSDAEINGASLIVFFNDGNAANNHDVVLFNGNDANFDNTFDALGWNSTLSGINYSGGSAAISFHVSDGQDFGAADDGSLRVNGATIATGGIFQGSSTPFSTGGVANGKLWDIRTFNVTSLLSPGLNSLNLQLSPVQDALSLVAVAIELPVGAAPVPEPSTPSLLATGLLAILGSLRARRGKGRCSRSGSTSTTST